MGICFFFSFSFCLLYSYKDKGGTYQAILGGFTLEEDWDGREEVEDNILRSGGGGGGRKRDSQETSEKEQRWGHESGRESGMRIKKKLFFRVIWSNLSLDRMVLINTDFFVCCCFNVSKDTF